jgi:hypothetical protein
LDRFAAWRRIDLPLKSRILFMISGLSDSGLLRHTLILGVYLNRVFCEMPESDLVSFRVAHWVFLAIDCKFLPFNARILDK